MVAGFESGVVGLRIGESVQLELDDCFGGFCTHSSVASFLNSTAAEWNEADVVQIPLSQLPHGSRIGSRWCTASLSSAAL